MNDTSIKAEAKYWEKICLSLLCNAANSFLYVNGVKLYQLKAKESEIKPYPLFLENISKNCTVDNVQVAGLKGFVYYFSVSYETIDTTIDTRVSIS